MDKQKFISNTPLATIRARMDSFSKAEAKVAHLVLADPAHVAASTIADTAAHAGVSEATVVRFCKSAGYKGYLNFRFALTQMLANPMHSIHGEIKPSDTIPQIAEGIIYSSIASLRDTLALIDPLQLDRAVQTVRGARQVIIVGVGTSAPFAVDLYNKLIRLGLPCEVITDPYIQLTRLALLGPDDAVIAVSHSGASAEPVNTLRYARERNITTIAMTGTVPSPITAHSDIILQYSARETRLEPVIARIALLAMSDVFFTTLAMQDIVRADENEKRIWELVITHTVAD